MMNKYFICFADTKYQRTLLRLEEQAKEYGLFDCVDTFNENFLSDDIKKYCLENTRGFGFWIWKPILIKFYLEKIDYNDILIYCDAGCTLNIEGKERFEYYMDILSKPENDIITFNMYDNLEKYWTKKDIFVRFNTEHLMETGQIGATSIIMKKTKKTIDLITEWHDICTKERHLLDDSPSENKETTYFIDNRHDQSLFSMVAKKYKTFELPDETYMILNGNHQNFDKQYPIQGTRLKF